MERIASSSFACNTEFNGALAKRNKKNATKHIRKGQNWVRGIHETNINFEKMKKNGTFDTKKKTHAYIYVYYNITNENKVNGEPEQTVNERNAHQFNCIEVV